VPGEALAEDTRFELVRGCPQHAFQLFVGWSAGVRHRSELVSSAGPCDGRTYLNGGECNPNCNPPSRGTLIARRGTDYGSGLGKQRWVVERAFARLHRFRRLRIRWEIRDDIHEAILALACALICRRRLRALASDAVG
jgi:transposase